MQINLRFLKLSIVVMVGSFFLVGCDDTNSESENAQVSHREVVAPNKENSTYLTDDTQYINEEYTNEKGEVEITTILEENGYLTNNPNEQFTLGFKNATAGNVSGLQVSYSIDKKSDMFNLRVVDPNGNLDTFYKRESIENIMKYSTTTNHIEKGNVANIFLIFRLFSIGMRVCSYTNCLDNSDQDVKSLELNNLYVHYNNKRKREVYSGTVADFYAKSNIYAKLPLVLDGGVKESDDVLTVTGGVRLHDRRVEKELLNYLRKTSENIWVNEKSTINVEAIELDGNDELLVVTIDKRTDEKLYDVKLNISALLGYRFDGTLISVAPELIAKIKVNGVTIEMLSGETGYTSSDTFKNLPLKKGDELEVTIYDDDAFYLDKLHTFSFVFDGKRVFNETETLTTTIEFLEEGKEVVNTAPKYDVKVTITGDADENHDEGGTLPDFTGAIYVDGKTYSIEKKNNTLVNEQVVKDIPINLNDKVTVVVIEEDVLWAPTTVMKHSFKFDANDMIEENKKVKVTLEFTEK